MTTRQQRPGARAAWFTSEIPPALSATARRRLIEANHGFLAEPQLDALDHELTILAREPQRFDVLPKTRRAELADLIRLLQSVRGGLSRLHPRSRDVLVGTLTAGWAWQAGDLRRLREALKTLLMACGEVLGEIPATGGRPNLARRASVVRTVCGWVESLEPTRAGAGMRTALTRNAARDTLHVPLRAPSARLHERQLASVKIVCEALTLPLQGAMSRIVRDSLSQKPT